MLCSGIAANHGWIRINILLVGPLHAREVNQQQDEDCGGGD